MKAREISELTKLMRGKALRTSPAAQACGASIDTRMLRAADLFFALEGNNSHGIEFAAQALKADAAAVVTTEAYAEQVPGPTIVVDDVEIALARLAAEVRKEESARVPGVAITGSLGKTTSCRWASELLKSLRQVHRPYSSYNNHLGVPLTILNSPQQTEILLAEVGANGPGEVLRYANWVRPQVACVTNVAPVHLEGFKDEQTIEREKLSILKSLDSNGVGWVPACLENRYRQEVASCKAPVFTYGPGGHLEVKACRNGSDFKVHWPVQGKILNLDWKPPFEHSIRTLEVALAVGLGLGFSLEELLENIDNLSTAPLRGELQEISGVEFMLDCYNSSPVAMESAINRLETEPSNGRRVCVVGTMEELGEREEDWHLDLGKKLGESNLDLVYVTGRAQKWTREGMRQCGRDSVLLSNDEQAAQVLARELKTGDRVLFKASRTDALERLAQRVGSLLREKT